MSIPIREKSIIGEKSYSHTLFINSCLSLLVRIQQIEPNILPSIELTEEWGIQTKEILYNDMSNTVKDIAYHLRNSLTHGHLKFESEEDVLRELHFEDYKNKGKEKILSFDMKTSFQSFQTFVNRLFDWVLENEAPNDYA